MKTPHLLLGTLAACLLLAGCGTRRAPGIEGDPDRGKVALAQYGCRSCHVIPGVTGSETMVGRPLDGLAQRKFIAGSLPNNQANLVRWIRNPQAVDPESAMPAMGVTQKDALDISAYLLTLE